MQTRTKECQMSQTSKCRGIGTRFNYKSWSHWQVQYPAFANKLYRVDSMCDLHAIVCIFLCRGRRKGTRIFWGRVRVPYQCIELYFGLFVGLSGITVHIFILSLRFHKTCHYGVYLSIVAICLLVVSVEHTCSNNASTSVDGTFCLLSLVMLQCLGPTCRRCCINWRGGVV